MVLPYLAARVLRLRRNETTGSTLDRCKSGRG